MRLVQEACALARLSHPNIVPIYEVGSVDGLHFYAMEFIRAFLDAAVTGMLQDENYGPTRPGRRSWSEISPKRTASSTATSSPPTCSCGRPPRRGRWCRPNGRRRKSRSSISAWPGKSTGKRPGSRSSSAHGDAVDMSSSKPAAKSTASTPAATSFRSASSCTSSSPERCRTPICRSTCCWGRWATCVSRFRRRRESSAPSMAVSKPVLAEEIPDRDAIRVRTGPTPTISTVISTARRQASAARPVRAPRLEQERRRRDRGRRLVAPGHRGAYYAGNAYVDYSRSRPNESAKIPSARRSTTSANTAPSRGPSFV